MIMFKKSLIPFVCSCLLFSTAVHAQKEKVEQNESLVFHNTTTILQAVHFSPKPWTDSFSVKIFKSYLEELDPAKRFLLSTDVNMLQPYEYRLDDELKGSDLQFYKQVKDVYVSRLKETSTLIENILKQPFNFNGNDQYILSKTLPFPSSEEERKNRWTNYLKYQVINQYEEMLQQRLKDSTMDKDDAKLEAKARANVLRIEKRVIDNLIKMASEESFNLYVNNIINLYDPHSAYQLPLDRREFRESLSGLYYGIGALLQEQTGKVSIKELMIGGPAWKSQQVEAGDVIVKVKQGGSDSSVNVEGFGMSDVVKLTRGSKGTFLTITFRKADGTLKDVMLKRDALQLDETFVKSAVLHDGDDKIGYIFVPKFYTSFGDPNGRSCAADMAKEIANLKKENVKGIVVDIRNNGGGSLGEVINMVGLFVKEGPVVQVKTSRSRPEVNGVKNPNVAWDGPLMVLVNELSASASEIFAGAIQDYRRGIVIGSRSTFGKGTVQRDLSVPLDLQRYPDTANDLGTLHVTFQKYYRITGEATQLKGVQSDIVIPGLYEPYKIQEKDNESALAWDKIEAASYNKYEKASVIEKIINAGNAKVQSDTSIATLKKHLDWVAARNENYSLNLKQFATQKKELRDHMAQVRSRINAPQKMMVQNITSVEEKLKAIEQYRQESNKAWLNSLKNDLYLYKTVDIMKDFIKAS
jgi:carboxyl-terminal processing protease